MIITSGLSYFALIVLAFFVVRAAVSSVKRNFGRRKERLTRTSHREQAAFWALSRGHLGISTIPRPPGKRNLANHKIEVLDTDNGHVFAYQVWHGAGSGLPDHIGGWRQWECIRCGYRTGPVVVGRKHARHPPDSCPLTSCDEFLVETIANN